MADLQKASSFFAGPVVKTVLVAGASGGGFVFVSDFFLARQFKDDAGEDTENAEYMRAGVQGVGGLVLAGMLAKWGQHDMAVGVGIGAVVGAARHIAIAGDLTTKLDEWFPESDAAPAAPAADPAAHGIRSISRSY